MSQPVEAVGIRTRADQLWVMLAWCTLLPEPLFAQAPDTTPPTAPREVNARAIDSNTVEVFWFDSVDNVGVTYRIYRATVIEFRGGYDAVTTTPVVVGTSTHSGLGQRGFLDQGLTPETDYKYWIAAVDPSGNESTRSESVHAIPTTPSAGTTIDTQVDYPSAVAPGENITIQQTITCSPPCSIGHHDVHWGTRMPQLTNQPGLSPGESAATVHINSVTFPAPSQPGNVYFMEDGHLGGTGYPLNGGGNPPHKEGMLYRIVVTSGAPMTINPTTLQSATLGTAYSQALTISGESSGIAIWGVNEGRLPPGLSISTGGVISGTPTIAGSYPFSVMVEDDQGTTSFRAYVLAVPGTDNLAPEAPTRLSVQ